MRHKYSEIEAVYNTLTEYYHHTTEYQHLALRKALNGVPAADVVEVVRCRECKFNTTEKKCLNPDSIIKIPDDNDFCSYGKRRI